MPLSRFMTVFITSVLVLTISLASTIADDGATPLVTDYYLAPPGSTYQTDSEIRRSGSIVRTSESTTRVMEQEQLDGQLMHVTRNKLTLFSPGGDQFSGETMIYQLVTPEKTCSYAYGSVGEEPERLNCLYSDLQAPLEVGATWSFSDAAPLSNMEIRDPVVMNFESTVVGFEKMTIRSHEFSNCIHTIEKGSGMANTEIRCDDGSATIPFVRVKQERWFCPGIPDTRFVSTETYLKGQKDGAVCTEYLTTRKVVAASVLAR